MLAKPEASKEVRRPFGTPATFKDKDFKDLGMDKLLPGTFTRMSFKDPMVAFRKANDDMLCAEETLQS